MHRFVCLLLLPAMASVNPGWQEAVPGYRYAFPRDHFEHPAFRTEWWYYTGNVWSKTGQRFGFELVFFRVGDRSTARDNPVAWRIDDIYAAHAALTDVNGRRFLTAERMNRSGPGIAGASFAERRIWNGNWSDAWNGRQQTLAAVTPEFSFRFTCVPVKPLVIQGENGVSQKAAGVGRASYYVSFPRLRVEGTVQTGGQTYSVSGQAWMDHEWFSNQLAAGQTGWDWFSIQLENGTELMLFELRRKDGSIDPYSSGTFVDSAGQAHHLRYGDFQLKPLATWKSAKSGARYPVRWAISVPRLHLNLESKAVLDAQELNVQRGANYWEGAVDFSGDTERGVGYLEMTGYDKPVVLGDSR